MIRYVVFAIGLVATQLSLRMVKFKATRNLLCRIPLVVGKVDIDTIGAQLVLVSHSRPVAKIGVDCVAESLFLEAVLRRDGLLPKLRFGVDPSNPSSAHAWVEVDGKPVNETADVVERWAAFESEIPL